MQDNPRALLNFDEIDTNTGAAYHSNLYTPTDFVKI